MPKNKDKCSVYIHDDVDKKLYEKWCKEIKKSGHKKNYMNALIFNKAMMAEIKENEEIEKSIKE